MNLAPQRELSSLFLSLSSLFAQIHHCLRPFIIDLESTNGTFVNDEKIPVSRYYELRASDGKYPRICSCCKPRCANFISSDQVRTIHKGIRFSARRSIITRMTVAAEHGIPFTRRFRSAIKNLLSYSVVVGTESFNIFVQRQVTDLC